MQCELCGKEGELYKVRIEGSILNVCKQCSAYGEVISRVKVSKPIFKVKKAENVASGEEEETIESVVEDYAKLVREKREALGLTQEELARKLNEKESIIHKIETGCYTPTIALAKKLERFLGIKLVTEEKITKPKLATKPRDDEHLTLADAIRLKKR